MAPHAAPRATPRREPLRLLSTSADFRAATELARKQKNRCFGRRVMRRATPQAQGFSDDEIRALKMTFAMLDQDCTGQLSHKDLGDYATAIGEGESVSPQDVHVVFTTLADSGSSICFEDWVWFAAKLKVLSAYAPA